MIDRYTKSVLTMIAVCLMILVIQNAIKPAHAQFSGGQVHVIVDKIGTSIATLPLPVTP